MKIQTISVMLIERVDEYPTAPYDFSVFTTRFVPRAKGGWYRVTHQDKRKLPFEQKYWSWLND